MRKWLILAIIIIIADQLSKAWAVDALIFEQSRPLTSFLNLALVYNTGAAFGFLASSGGWQLYVFATLAIIASIILIVLLHKHQKEKRSACAFSLILGGAIGNLIDRFNHGYVVDFIDFYYKNYHWPAFNVADSAICIGAVLIVIDSLWPPKRAKGAR